MKKSDNNRAIEKYKRSLRRRELIYRKRLSNKFKKHELTERDKVILSGRY